jgi:hypothetical protein
MSDSSAGPVVGVARDEFEISAEARSFIESAKILAEPYEECIAQLRAENERLRFLVDSQLGDCTGCTTEPEETCPRDGRTYTEWAQIASDQIGRANDAEQERDAAVAALAAVAELIGDCAGHRDVPAEVERCPWCKVRAVLAAPRPGATEERPRCDRCHRPLPHTEPEKWACAATGETE